MVRKNVDKEIGERLRDARKRLGLKLQDVAKGVGFKNYQTLSAIEKGERSLKVAELSRLASIYCRDMTYFLVPEGDSRERSQIAWRGTPTDEGTLRSVQERAEFLWEYYSLLETVNGEQQQACLGGWRIEDARIGYQDVAERAEQMIKDLELGARPASTIPNALERLLSVKVLFYDLGDDCSAISGVGEFGCGVVINSNHAPWRRIFSLAHEVYHLLRAGVVPLETVHTQGSQEKPKEEKLADAFGAALLMPREAIIKAIKERTASGKLKPVDLVAVAMDFGVSTEALLWRLANLENFPKLTPDRVESTLAKSDLKLADRQARAGKNTRATPFSDRMISLGLRALSQGKISKGKFCQIFEIKRADFDDFISERGDTRGFMDETEIEIDNT